LRPAGTLHTMSTGNGSAPQDELAERLRATTELLDSIVRDRSLLKGLSVEERTRLLSAAGDVFNPDAAARRRSRKRVRRQEKAERRLLDEAVLAETGIRVLREKPAFTTPNTFPPGEFEQHDVDDADFREVVDPKHCYVCKEPYVELHPFYDQLCPPCAAFNFAKRTESADLSGRVALLTGGRVKIGYQAGIKLLRAGAQLIVTTRFPRDSAARYAQEPDFADWSDRLEIFGLDLRHTPSVEAFCHHLIATHERLDFIISNACQTVRRPPEYYRHMLDLETAAAESLPHECRQLLGAYEGLRRYDMLPAGESVVAERDLGVLTGVTRSAELSQVPLLPGEDEGRRDLFPEGLLDQDLQQVDLRERNSWRYLLDEVSTVELLETQLVNAVAPFVLNARLKPLMLRTPERDKHIVNVSAVEGQFYRKFKTTRHPHTNMAKAALNMMTRTSATDYYNDGIHMNSVDTGWVTDEDPLQIAERKTAEHGFNPPLDIVDGAARIVDPIVDGFNTGEHVWGLFLKDYKPIDW
jgi:NAD(P)-dependent dehydrogenase (short-subunit alcohol dehydrogenase family)